MIRCNIHNLITGQRYEFTATDQAAVDTKLLAKEKVYGKPETREPVRVVNNTYGHRIDDISGSSLTYTEFTLEGETETVVSTVPLSNARPQWYAGGRTPTIDGQEVVVPSERNVIIADITADVNRTIVINAVQSRLDAHAQSWGYDSIFTACTYADEASVPQFQAEGQVLRSWRSTTWAACHQHTDAPSLDALLATLPEPPGRPS